MERQALSIKVVTGAGSGPTQVSAFDAALRDATIANYNLIQLSSVIPEGIEVVSASKPVELAGLWGDRLSVVMAKAVVTTPKSRAFAGLGWVREPGHGRGLFVEHEGSSRDEVVRMIKDSLGSMCGGRPALQFGPVEMQVAGVTCLDEPACVLVAAAFDTEPW